MLYPASQIDKHDQKLAKLSHSPEHIDRYKKCSKEMWLTCISSSPNEISRLDEADIDSDLIQAAISNFNGSYHNCCDHFINRLISLNYSNWSIELINLCIEKDLSVHKLISKCVSDIDFSREHAEILTSGGFASHPMMFNYPELLKKQLADNGCYLADIYCELGTLTQEQVLTAFEGDIKHWSHKPCHSFKVGHIVAFYAKALLLIKDKSSFYDGLCERGYIGIIPKEEQTSNRALIAAKHPNFYTFHFSRNEDSKGSPIAHLWSAATAEVYLTVVPEGLKSFSRCISYIQGINDYILSDLFHKAVGFDITNLEHLDSGFAVTDTMVNIYAQIHPLNIWSLPECWVSTTNIETAIKSNPLSVFYGGSQLESSTLELASKEDPEIFIKGVTQDLITPSFVIRATRVMTADIAKLISVSAPSVYHRLVRDHLRVDDDIKTVITQGHMDVLDSEFCIREPFISLAALHCSFDDFRSWAKCYGIAFLQSDTLSCKDYSLAVQKNENYLRVLAQFGSISNVISVCSFLDEKDLAA